jgi:hypothetical protein
MGYNPEAIKFQSDFLNDDYSLLPDSLKQTIESGQDMLIFYNPPYATASNLGTNEGDHKEGVAKTEINKQMLNDGWGDASKNLYAQFLYRAAELQKINKNIKIAVFCPPLFLSGESFAEFRNKFFQLFGFEKGFLFEASNFSDVAKGWGISFSIFSEKLNNNEFKFDLIQDGGEFNLNTFGSKTITNTDNTIAASKWVREEIKKLPKVDMPNFSTALKVNISGNKNGLKKGVDNSLGCMNSNSKSFYKNGNDVVIVSSVSLVIFISQPKKSGLLEKFESYFFIEFIWIRCITFNK